MESLHGWLIEVYNNGNGKMTAREYEIWLYKLENANEKIFSYRAHIIRTWVQLSEWNLLLENMDEKNVLITFDWAMSMSISSVEIACY